MAMLSIFILNTARKVDYDQLLSLSDAGRE